MDGFVYSIQVENGTLLDISDHIKKQLLPEDTEETGEADEEENLNPSKSTSIKLQVFGVTVSPNDLLHTIVYRCGSLS